MSKFYAYYTGPGGCDYTIGCNNDLQELSATNKHDAELEIQEAYSHMEEYGIEKVQLFEVKSVEDIDVTEIDKKMAEERRHKEIKRVEAEERAQYEKLKNKFNPKK
jgi:hypothetical protein